MQPNYILRNVLRASAKLTSSTDKRHTIQS